METIDEPVPAPRLVQPGHIFDVPDDAIQDFAFNSKVPAAIAVIAAAVPVQDQDELMLMTSSGQSVRIRVQDIRETGRNTMGVKLMALAEGEIIQDIAPVIGDEDEETADTGVEIDDKTAEGTGEEE